MLSINTALRGLSCFCQSSNDTPNGRIGGSIFTRNKLGEGNSFIVELALRIQKQEDDPQF